MSGRVRFRTTICGIAELEGHAGAGVTHALSILDPGWPELPEFAALGARRRLALRFHDIIDAHPEMRLAAPEDVARLLAFGHELAAMPEAHLLVHCHMGVSRSSAAMLLIVAQAYPELPAADIIAKIVRIRPKAWPNLRLVELGDEALERRGELVAAARARYREVIGRRPEVVANMLEMGRGREISDLLP